MRHVTRYALAGALSLIPAAALAQGAVVVEEPPLIIEEPAMYGAPAVVVTEPAVVPGGGPLGVEDARAIAMMNGLATVEDVDRTWGGDFEVEGEDVSGRHLEVTIDADSGAVLEIDD